ncbi:2476_t:CDS:2, partial [Funneliformis mosseae]
KSFLDKIGQYLTSLVAITKNESGKRSKKALHLYKQYKQGPPRSLSFKSLSRAIKLVLRVPDLITRYYEIGYLKKVKSVLELQYTCITQRLRIAF